MHAELYKFIYLPPLTISPICPHTHLFCIFRTPPGKGGPCKVLPGPPGVQGSGFPRGGRCTGDHYTLVAKGYLHLYSFSYMCILINIYIYEGGQKIGGYYRPFNFLIFNFFFGNFGSLFSKIGLRDLKNRNPEVKICLGTKFHANPTKI